ncbi:MAG TPA: hypothetical protein VK821_21450 [Dehalococcoidia bacterium]|nr:hypothetical protein [Dehalococcoidia bacterium]
MVQEEGPRAEDQINVSGAVMLTDLPVGARVRLRNGAVAEVTANPRDGGWIFIRFLEHQSNPARVGEEDMAFCADVIAVLP